MAQKIRYAKVGETIIDDQTVTIIKVSAKRLHQYGLQLGDAVAHYERKDETGTIVAAVEMTSKVNSFQYNSGATYLYATVQFGDGHEENICPKHLDKISDTPEYDDADGIELADLIAW